MMFNYLQLVKKLKKLQQTIGTTGPDDMYLTRPGKNGLLDKSA